MEAFVILLIIGAVMIIGGLIALWVFRKRQPAGISVCDGTDLISEFQSLGSLNNIGVIEVPASNLTSALSSGIGSGCHTLNVYITDNAGATPLTWNGNGYAVSKTAVAGTTYTVRICSGAGCSGNTHVLWVKAI